MSEDEKNSNCTSEGIYLQLGLIFARIPIPAKNIDSRLFRANILCHTSAIERAVGTLDKFKLYPFATRKRLCKVFKFLDFKNFESFHTRGTLSKK